MVLVVMKKNRTEIAARQLRLAAANLWGTHEVEASLASTLANLVENGSSIQVTGIVERLETLVSQLKKEQ